MKTIGEYSTHLPHTIGRQTTIEKAREMMEQNKCHHLPVLDGGKLVGVLSSTDLARVSNDSAHVNDIMTDEPLVVNPEDGVKEVIGRMLKNHYGSAIVSAQGDSPWAIFTSIDAMKLLHEMLP